jgi:hypothetical protein
MYKIHRPHLASGYLKSIRYEATRDGEGNPDWDMFYTPGPKARAEHNAFSKSGRMIDSTPEIVQAEVAISPRQPKPRVASRQKHFSFIPATAETIADDPVIAELTRRGIGAGKAQELAAGRKPEDVIDQLEWGDHLVRNARRAIVNPAGFYIHLITSGITAPDDFETSRKRKERDDARAAADQAQFRRLELEHAYTDYRATEVDRHVAAHVRPEDFEQLIAGKMKELKHKEFSRNLPVDTLRTWSERFVRSEIAKTLPLQTFEEFERSHEGGEAQQATLFS